VLGARSLEQHGDLALAGVLLVTAYRMVEIRNIRSVFTSTRSDAAVFAVTAICTVAFDLITAVAVGLVLAGVLALRRLAGTSQAVAVPLMPDGLSTDAEHVLLAEHVLVYRLDGPLFFPVVGRFLTEMTAVVDVRVVILRLSSLVMLDASGAKALGDLVEELAQREGGAGHLAPGTVHLAGEPDVGEGGRRMSDAPRNDPDRELFGQGLANIASGLCGGMPATGAIARTAVNTRVAALTHAVVLAVIIFAAAPLVGQIPLVNPADGSHGRPDRRRRR